VLNEAGQCQCRRIGSAQLQLRLRLLLRLRAPIAKAGRPPLQLPLPFLSVRTVSFARNPSRYRTFRSVATSSG
jgi:hypothetical protein